MPGKNKVNFGLDPVFLLIRRCVRVLYASINALTRIVIRIIQTSAKNLQINPTI